MKIQITCKTCGKVFEAYEQQKRKFCSRSCAATYNNSVEPKRKINYVRNTHCAWCSSPLLGRGKRNNKYCSHECHWSQIRQEKIEAGTAGVTAWKTHLLRKCGSTCSVCGLSEWNGQSMPIELDHIDGDSTNTVEENLRLICPNCHAQTDTYKGKNMGQGRHYRRERYKNGQSY